MRTADPRALANMLDEWTIRQATSSLRLFLPWVWPILEPGRPFQPNWHLDYLTEYLEAVSAGEIIRLLVNVPPRHGKSILISVCWPVFRWLRHPEGRWLFVCGTDALAMKQSLDRRRLLTADALRRRYPDIELVADQRSKPECHNRRRGAFVASTLAGPLIGKGGEWIVVDDPQSMQQVESEVQRETQTDLLRSVIHTRLDDKRRGGIVLVQQRLHAQDLSAVALELGYTPVVLPAVQPARQRYIFPRSRQVMIREAGAALWPTRENPETLARVRAEMGSYAFSAQYLQCPQDPRGQLFPPHGWRRYDALPEDPELMYIQSWDFAFKGDARSDFTVGLVAACRGSYIYLVARVKGRLSFTDAKKKMLEMLDRYPQTRTVLVEEAANGAAIVDALRGSVRGLVAIRPKGGKQSRASAAQARVECGQVLLPTAVAGLGDLRVDPRFVDDFVESLARFPNTRHDDDVDACSQLVAYLNDHPLIEAADAVKEPPPSALDRLAEACHRVRQRRMLLFHPLESDDEPDDEIDEDEPPDEPEQG
jgi:predicted phage terminase large subunit-like protein